MEEDLLRRAADLAERCERTATVTSTAFLTPAEQYTLTNWARHRDCTLVLHGGAEGCERRAAFFLPFYLTAEDFDPAEHLRAVHFSAPFGAPGHRDYLGAILGLGIRREWVGDILVQNHGAYVFCLPSVAPALLELEQVGRTGVKAAAAELAAVPVPERKVRPVTFTVQSARLDAVVSGMFRLSRTSAAAQIRAGAVHLNYSECLRPDAPVAPGDVLSLRGAGKGSVTEVAACHARGGSSSRRSCGSEPAFQINKLPVPGTPVRTIQKKISGVQLRRFFIDTVHYSAVLSSAAGAAAGSATGTATGAAAAAAWAATAFCERL